LGFGEDDGLTAGSGNAGEGEADLRNAEMEDCAGEPEKDDRRLEENGGGFIGSETEVGVPGAEEVGDSVAMSTCVERVVVDIGKLSVGAGLPDIRLPGRSILVDRLYCDSVNWPSRFFRAQMCTDRSLL
jgi:hypothetical protein